MKTLLSKTTKPLGIVIIIACVCVAGYLYYRYISQHPSTDDAYVQANVINMAPQVTGQINQVLVQNHQFTKKGQLLLTLDQRPFLIAVKKAQADLQTAVQNVKSEKSAVQSASASVTEAKAKLTNAQHHAKRVLALVKKHLASPAQGDQAQSDLEVANASLKAAKAKLAQAIANLGDSDNNNAKIQAARAQLAQAFLDLDYTKIKAPEDGYVNNFNLRPGQTVSAYQPLFSFVASHHWWVEANYKETDLQHIKPGQPANIKVDMYPNHTFHGKVESISTGSGASFSLLPPENASGNWVKVTQRFPVRISIHADKSFPLRLGASATVTINTTQTHESN